MRKSRLIALAAALAIVLPLGVALAEVDFAKVM